MQHDILADFIDNLSYLKGMYQLNLELLEQLAVASDYIVKNSVNIPNKSTINSLLNKAMTLLNEIQADEPKILTYNVNRRKVTVFNEKDRTDGEVTEPVVLIQSPNFQQYQ